MACLLPAALVVVLSVLLYIPPIQDFAVRKASEYAGAATGMRIGIQRIRLHFPLDLNVQGVEIVADSVPADTVLSLQNLTVRIRPLPLLRKEVLVEAVDVQGVKVNTGTLIDGMEIKGALGRLYLHADRISLGNRRAVFNRIELSDTALTLLLDETGEADTTATEPADWSILLEQIRFDNVALACQMPQDSLRFSAFIRQAGIEGGEIDLGKSFYRLQSFRLAGSSMNYDGNFEVPAEGLDPNHIELSDLDIDLRTAFYAGKNIEADLRGFSFRERSGLRVDTIDGTIHSDEHQFHLPGLRLKTAHSEALLAATVPWKALEGGDAEATAHFSSALGKEDLLLLAGALPDDFVRSFPEQPLKVAADARGNGKSLRADLTGDWENILRMENGELEIENLTETLPGKAAQPHFRLSIPDFQLQDLSFLRALVPAETRPRIRIPQDMRFHAEVEAEMDTAFSLLQSALKLHLRETDGTLDVDARYRAEGEAYSLAARIDSLEPVHFLPADSLYWLTASLRAEGEGTDFFNEKTWAKLEGEITDIRYGNASVSDIRLSGSLKEHFAQVDFLSRYPLAQLDMSLNATLKEKDIQAMLIADMQHLDLKGLHLLEQPISTSFQVFAEASTDLDKRYDADITIGNWEIASPKKTSRPKSLIFRAHSDADTTALAFHAGDLNLTLSGDRDLLSLSGQLAKVSEEADRQMAKDSVFHLNELRPLLPNLRLAVEAKKENPVFNLAQLYSVEFDNIGIEAHASPGEGIHIDGGVYHLVRDTFEIDTIQMCIRQDTAGILYEADVIKHKLHQQEPFSISLKGQLQTTFADALLRYADGRDSTGILLGARMDKIENGVKLHLFPEEPILAFSRFRLNPDNYLIYRNEKDIRADLQLSSLDNGQLTINNARPDSTDLSLYSIVNCQLSNIRLGAISQAFPAYLPAMDGLLNADFQYIPSDSSFMVVSGMSIDSLHYNKGRVGDMLMNLVYLPSGENEHQVDLHLIRDEQEILAATALYASGQEGRDDRLEGYASVTELPLLMLNPFIPDGMARLNGALLGEINIAGSTGKPEIDGYLQLDTARMYVAPANTTLSFEPKKIGIRDNRIHFDRYSIYSSGKNPFVIDGNIDFENPANMIADLRLTADNMQLLNTKRQRNSLVYGKMFVNLNSTVKGPLSTLVMRGDLQLLGGTNFTYVLQDSPLTVQDRLSGLVTFTSFDEDSLHHHRTHQAPLALGGIDMLMTIHIDQAVQANVDLTPDQSSHVNLEGGGDLSFQYTPMGDMILSGRYTFSSGVIKYSLPIIPLKEFNVTEGSYVQWTGDPMDPTLNLKATERIRTSVAIDDNSTRMVNFDVGISLTQRLENLGLQFTLEAPEDAAIQEQLARLGDEERAKQAVSMLVTGMYLAGGTSGKANLNMGAALNSFLQSEISNIAGSALKTIDINFGMESYDEDGDGSKRTDYSFRFAKRFYNDRIRVVLGGRISTGADINKGQAQPFIDNVSIEYRLDQSGTRYVKLFHNKDYESLLEGELIETGAGIVLRKKMQHLRELFIFKKKKTEPVKEENEE